MVRENIRGIDEEIVGLRVLGRGLLERQARATSGTEAAQLGDSYSKAAYRLGELMRAEAELEILGRTSERADDFLNRLDKLAVEHGWEPVGDSIRADALRGDVELKAAARRLVEEIASLRYVLRNTFRLAMEGIRERGEGGGGQEAREYMRLVEIYGSGCVRLVKLLKMEEGGGSRLEVHLDELIQDAMEEARDRLGVRWG